MKKYKPKNYTQEKLLEKMCFVKAENGFILERKPKKDSHIRIHALLSFDGINFHKDYLGVNGEHIASTKNLGFFYNFARSVDSGEEMDIPVKILNKYPALEERYALIIPKKSLKDIGTCIVRRA